MNSSTTESPSPSYLGHVKNGVIVVDAMVTLSEGQAVRIAPLVEEIAAPIADQLQRMKTLFAQWDEEDSSLTDEEADRLQLALQQNRGLSFRTPQLD